MKKVLRNLTHQTGRTGKVIVGLWAGVAGFLTNALATNTISLTTLQTNVGHTEFDFVGIMEVVLTLAGVLLIIKGIVHFKQQYTSGGGGQEKHLSKGIASCIFGACLFLVVPITHALVGAVGSGAGATSWTISNGAPASINS